MSEREIDREIMKDADEKSSDCSKYGRKPKMWSVASIFREILIPSNVCGGRNIQLRLPAAGGHVRDGRPT